MRSTAALNRCSSRTESARPPSSRAVPELPGYRLSALSSLSLSTGFVTVVRPNLPLFHDFSSLPAAPDQARDFLNPADRPAPRGFPDRTPLCPEPPGIGRPAERTRPASWLCRSRPLPQTTRIERACTTTPGSDPDAFFTMAARTSCSARGAMAAVRRTPRPSRGHHRRARRAADPVGVREGRGPRRGDVRLEDPGGPTATATIAADGDGIDPGGRRRLRGAPTDHGRWPTGTFWPASKTPCYADRK